jgi:hypothetical protein
MLLPNTILALAKEFLLAPPFLPLTGLRLKDIFFESKDAISNESVSS